MKMISNGLCGDTVRVFGHTVAEATEGTGPMLKHMCSLGDTHKGRHECICGATWDEPIIRYLKKRLARATHRAS